MRRLKICLSFAFVLCFLVACIGGNKFVIKERFSQNPTVGVIYSPSKINKFPDNTQGGPHNNWGVPVPAGFESIAKNEIVRGLKSEWPNADIRYEQSAVNQKNYDLVVWVHVGGTYNVQSAGGANNSKLTLEMRTTLSIYDPHKVKNLTSLMGASMGEVTSTSARINSDSVFIEAIPPTSLKRDLEKRMAQGIVDYFKEVKASKK